MSELVVTRDFELAFDEEAFLKLHGPGLERPVLRSKLAPLLDEIGALAAPTACYRAYAVEAFLHERLQLAGGTRIGSGPVASVVGGAEELYVALCTIGPALDERVREYQAAGRHLEMLLLDELGSWAVDQMRQQLYERIQAQLAEDGWRTSSPLSPGESTWPIREQRIIFKLLDATQVGIELGPADLMSPFKSLSLIFGAGSREMGSEGLTNCDFCSIQDRCKYAATR